MAKKAKRSTSVRTTRPRAFDPESSPWFVPIAFGVAFLALLVLFGGFIFSNEMLRGSDTIEAGIFFRSFYVDYVHEHGAVPQWNPYIFCGMPYVEAFHGDIFYPLSALKFFGSIYRMLGINLVLHIFLAGIFMYLAARRFRLSKIASLLSGACYMFASYLVSLVAPGHDGKIFVTTLFPLVVYFLEGGFESTGYKSFFRFSMLGLVLGVIILSPHPQMSYYTLWAVAFYAAFKLILAFKDGRAFPAILRPAALTAYAVLIGLLVSAIQFYPGYLYTSNFSPRADSKQGWEWATSWSMNEEEAFSLLIPEFAGSSSQKANTYYWGKNYFKDNSEAVGVVSIFIALIGFFFYRRWESYFFGGLALFALLYALGAATPVFKIFYYLIPKVKSLRAPSMIMFMFSFSVALLAGMGLQYVRDRTQKNHAGNAESRRFNWLLFGFPALMLALALLFSVSGKGMLSAWTSLFYSEAPTEIVQQGVTKLDLAYANLPGIQAGAWFAFLFTALAALFIWLYRSRVAGVAVLLAVVLIPVIDGVRFNSRFVGTVDPAMYWSPNPVSEFFSRRDGHYRVMNFGVMPEDLLPFFGVQVVTGYHGNQLRWYDELLGGPGAKNQINPNLLNLAGARYLLIPAGQQLPDGYFGDRPVDDVATFGSAKIVENHNALPRVYLVGKYRVFEDRSDIYPLILNGTDTLRQIVYLEKEPSLEIVPDSLNNDSAWIADYANDSVLVGLDCSMNQLLVLTDNYYEAWHVYVDGQPAELLRSYGTFRAVAVPAGTKQVLFKYKSEKYATGKLVTVVTSLYLLVVVGIHIYRTRARRDKKEKTTV